MRFLTIFYQIRSLNYGVSWISAGFILPIVYLAFMKKLERHYEEIGINS